MNRAHLQLGVSKPAQQVAENNEQSTRTGCEGLGNLSLTISARLVGIAAVSQVTDHEGRQFWVVAAEREDAGRFIVHAHDMPTAFLELHAAIHRQLELG